MMTSQQEKVDYINTTVRTMNEYWTMQQIADAAGVDRSNLYRFRIGRKKNAHDSVVEGVSRAWDTFVREVLTGYITLHTANADAHRNILYYTDDFNVVCLDRPLENNQRQLIVFSFDRLAFSRTLASYVKYGYTFVWSTDAEATENHILKHGGVPYGGMTDE